MASPRGGRGLSGRYEGYWSEVAAAVLICVARCGLSRIHSGRYEVVVRLLVLLLWR